MNSIPHLTGRDTTPQDDSVLLAGREITRVIADSAEISRMLARIAHQILEANHGHADLVLLGIPSRGVPLARRLAAEIERIEGQPVRHGALDVTMYRDDLRRNPTREAGRSDVPGSIEDAVVVLVDDV
ncbi:MAG: bifunctional pyr operon transcriptional regulator/uracil phosphoribosyltransferase, partial [Propionibacteriaceae bacterium]|nr:bifunctional pyr operon transcriptional regulator/uracil phosphoribosyltransferase [Propionibacteriaceae bacterium]